MRNNHRRYNFFPLCLWRYFYWKCILGFVKHNLPPQAQFSNSIYFQVIKIFQKALSKLISRSRQMRLQTFHFFFFFSFQSSSSEQLVSIEGKSRSRQCATKTNHEADAAKISGEDSSKPTSRFTTNRKAEKLIRFVWTPGAMSVTKIRWSALRAAILLFTG